MTNTESESRKDNVMKIFMMSLLITLMILFFRAFCRQAVYEFKYLIRVSHTKNVKICFNVY